MADNHTDIYTPQHRHDADLTFETHTRFTESLLRHALDYQPKHLATTGAS